MTNKTTSSTSSLNLFGLLGVAFIILKLCNIIDWSWWWVTLPLWGGIALVLSVALFAIFLAFIISIINNR